MTKQISVLIGAGSIGQAIIRRVSAGKHVVLTFSSTAAAPPLIGTAIYNI